MGLRHLTVSKVIGGFVQLYSPGDVFTFGDIRELVQELGQDKVWFIHKKVCMLVLHYIVLCPSGRNLIWYHEVLIMNIMITVST